MSKMSVYFHPSKITFSSEVPHGARIVWMPIPEYIDRVNVRNRMSSDDYYHYSRRNEGNILHHPPFSMDKIHSIARNIEKGNLIDVPTLDYRDEILSDQEGFHRALYAKYIGTNHTKLLNKMVHEGDIPVAIWGDILDYTKASEPPERKMTDITNINPDMKIKLIE